MPDTNEREEILQNFSAGRIPRRWTILQWLLPGPPVAGRARRRAPVADLKFQRVPMIHKGSCHCQGIKFEVEAPVEIDADHCNCSICSKSGFLHLIVPLSKFKLVSGEELITTYTFNTGIAKHTFCKVCGVKPFYTPRSNPDGIDVNVHCLDTEHLSVNIVEFDGKNWEQNAHNVAHKSKET